MTPKDRHQLMDSKKSCVYFTSGGSRKATVSLFAHIKPFDGTHFRAVSMQEHARVRLLYFLHNRKINQQVKAARGGSC